MRRPLVVQPRTIRGTLFVLIAIVLVPLVAFGVYEVVDEYRRERDAEVDASADVARALASAFDAFIQHIVRTEQAAAISFADHAHSARQIHDELARMITQFPAVRDASWIDARGMVVASTEPLLIGKSLYAREYFREISTGAEWRVSPLLRSLLDAKPLFIVARGHRRPTGELAGVVAAAVDAEKLGSFLGQRSSGTTSIYDSEGALVAVQPPRPLGWDDRRRTSEHPWVRRALGGGQALGIFRSPSTGDLRVGAFVPIRSIGWVARASRPLDEAMAPVRRSALRNAVALVAVALAALGAALVLARRIAEPLRALEQHAARLARGGATHVPLRGPVEVRRVAHALDWMASSLAARRADLEAVNRRLATSEERFRLLAENAQDLVFRYRLLPEPGFEYVSPAATRMVGYTPEEHYANPRLGLEIVHPDDRAKLEGVLRGGGDASEPLLLRWIRKDGAVIWMEQRNTTVRDAEGRAVAVEGIARDVTERTEAAAALALATRAAEAHGAELEAMLAALPAGLVIVDPDQIPVRVNDAAREMLRFPPDAPRLPPEQRRAGVRFWSAEGRPLADDERPSGRALRGELVRGVVLRIERLGGDPPGGLWVAASSAPIRDPAGAIRGAVTAFVDITQLRDLQEERETLMQMVSHDLRTPLHVVVGHAQILHRRGDEETRRRSEAILASAGRMTRLIGDLVDAARLETGRVALRLEPLDVRTFLTAWKERMAGALDVGRVRLVVPGPVPMVLADAGRFEQILVNLVSNALKYSIAGSEVRVELTATGSALRVSVADRGPGIAPEELPRLFERYYRANSAVRAEGLGLGLFIARKLVEAHGWRIEVESELGTGSVFTVVVPVAGGREAATAAA